jgi:hypothetical protein
MNRGGSAVTLREVMIGVAVREGIWRSIASETMVSLLPSDEADEPAPIILGAGEAKHFSYSAVDIRKDYLGYLDFNQKSGLHKMKRNFHVLEIWHSRSSRRHFTVLDHKPLTEGELDKLALKK